MEMELPLRQKQINNKNQKYITSCFDEALVLLLGVAGSVEVAP